MSRRGMTLVEMLVAMTATLVLMAAVAQAFSVFGNAITGSRSVLELDGRMRETAWRLRADLGGATARPLPPLAAEAGEGYFEIIEGPLTDFQNAAATLPAPLVTGVTPIGPTDVDDVLLFTTQSPKTPFLGRAPTGSLESTLAEVAWFARPTPGTAGPPTYTLYRRQLLVVGAVGTGPFSANNSVTMPTGPTPWSTFFDTTDASVRRERTPPAMTLEDRLFPNTLADLARRETRFLHNPDGLTGSAAGNAFPFVFAGGNHQTTPAPDGLIFGPGSPRLGEDVILTNVLAFDVRVFDPAVAVIVTTPGDTPLVPGDPGYSTAAGSTAVPVTSGGYVDLGHGVTSNAVAPRLSPRFSAVDAAVATSGETLRRTYDTWTTAYEANGRDEDGRFGIDQSVNGLDDDGDGVIDDPGEFETVAPYAHPLRGIEVRIRCYEPSSRQVRQVTVRHSFVPH